MDTYKNITDTQLESVRDTYKNITVDRHTNRQAAL